MIRSLILLALSSLLFVSCAQDKGPRQFVVETNYGNMTFESWCKESEKSYMSYFSNKELYNRRKYTYSQFVNAQIIAIT